MRLFPRIEVKKVLEFLQMILKSDHKYSLKSMRNIIILKKITTFDSLLRFLLENNKIKHSSIENEGELTNGH